MSFSIGSSSSGMGPRSALHQFGTERDGRAFNRRVVVRMLAYLRPYWRQMLAAFGLMLLASGLTLLTPYLIKVAIDQYIVAGDMGGLTRVTLLTALAFLGLYLTTAGQRYFLSWVGQ